MNNFEIAMNKVVYWSLPKCRTLGLFTVRLHLALMFGSKQGSMANVYVSENMTWVLNFQPLSLMLNSAITILGNQLFWAQLAKWPSVVSV